MTTHTAKLSGRPARGIGADDERPVTSVTPDTAWTAVFDRTDGWTGADCAASVDLGDGRTLWMFGDTWLSKIRDGKRQPGATMVNNSLAVHPTDKSAPWRPPDPRSVHFLWGANDKDGKPTAWAVPPPIAGDTESAHDWLWCNGGGAVGVGPDGKSPRLRATIRAPRTIASPMKIECSSGKSLVGIRCRTAFCAGGAGP